MKKLCLLTIVLIGLWSCTNVYDYTIVNMKTHHTSSYWSTKSLKMNDSVEVDNQKWRIIACN